MFVQLLKDFMGKKLGERIDVSQEDAKALISAGSAEEVKGDLITPAVTKAMEGIAGNFTKALEEGLNAQLKAFADAQTKSRKNSVPAIFGSNVKGDTKKTFGNFLLAIATKDLKALDEMGSQFRDWTGDIEKKVALNVQTGAQGGFTVPVEFSQQLLSLSAEQSVIEPRATHIPMASNIVDVPALDVTQVPTSGETAFFGGLQANWEEEASSIGEEEPTFKQIRLQARELKGYTLASNSLLQDNAIGLEAVLLALFGGALAWFKDRAFLRGSGANQPLGIVSSGSLISVTRSAASAVSLADVAGMMGRLLPGWSPRQTIWVVHPTVLVKLLTMAETAVGGRNTFIIDGVTKQPVWELLGLPIHVSEKLPALNTAGDILLADCSKYLVGQRQDVEIAFSEHVAFRTNQGAWRFVCRVDGQPWLRSAITLSDATSTLSPFVALAAG